MASSLQCNRPTNETCQQKCNGGSSLGQKMSSWVKGHNNNNGQQACKPSFQAQAQTRQNHVATSKTQTHCSSYHTQAHHLTGQGLAEPQQQAQCANKASGGHHTHTHTHAHSQTKHHATDGVTCKYVNKSNGHGHKHGHNHGHKNSGAACPSKMAAATCKQKKDRNLFGRIKDRLSGHSSCSDSSSSSSDSESDNESCRKRKN